MGGLSRRDWIFGTGLGAMGTSSTSPMQQNRARLLFDLGLERIGRACFSCRCDCEGCCLLSPLPCTDARGGLEGVSCSATSNKPNLSTNVSTLVLSRISRFGRLRGVALADCEACSLCCQQYPSTFSSRRLEFGLELGDFAFADRGDPVTALRHSRPLEVSPRHVAFGFFESERGSKASGV